jgi:hypothetical protein
MRCMMHPGQFNCDDKSHFDTSVICNWCGARVKWLKLGEHMDEHHRTQRVYRPLAMPKAVKAVVFAEWRQEDAEGEENDATEA